MPIPTKIHLAVRGTKPFLTSVAEQSYCYSTETQSISGKCMSVLPKACLLYSFQPAYTLHARNLRPKTVADGRSCGNETLPFGGRTFVSTPLAWACSANLGRSKNKLQIDAAGTRATHRNTRTWYGDVRAAPDPAAVVRKATAPTRLQAGSSDNSKRVIQFF